MRYRWYETCMLEKLNNKQKCQVNSALRARLVKSGEVV
jgi:hypothetical protein